MTRETISDHYAQLEFETLLDEAELRATTDFELRFVDALQRRYADYGMAAAFTDRQKETLESIVNERDSRP